MRPPNGSSGSSASSRSPIARVRRLWLTLTVAASAALLVPWLIVSRADGAGVGALVFAASAALLVLGAAWLAFERLVAPELRALERARAELDARHAAALRAAGETSDYLRDVSHEIRATMHAVLGQTQLLSRSPLDATQHRHMRTIDGAARVLLRIINDLMTLPRSGRRGFDVVPLGGSLHDVLRVSADLLETAAKNRGLELELRVAFDLPDRVMIDAGRVEQLLLGACRHAIDARARGTLRLDARPLELTESRFVLSVRVESHPEGVPEADAASAAGPASASPVSAGPASASPVRAGPASASPLENIASHEPSRATAPPRVLRTARPAPGQALLLELVAALGGSLQLDDGTGAIELRLPVQRIDNGTAPRLRPPPEAAALIRLPATTAPLLVVDADDRSRSAAIEMLENLGFEAEGALSAPQAIERVAQTPFALILLDTDLVGLDGYMAAARILTQLGQRRPPIIGLCRPPLAQARERAAAAGMDALLAKPLEREALCAALAEWLPDENDPASSGMRLSQAGALAQATQRARDARASQPPPGGPNERARGAQAAAIERLVREAPGHFRALEAALARGARDEAARSATSLAERCASCGALELLALCRIVEAGRELPGEQLTAAVQALGRALDAALGQLATPVEHPDSPPASVTHDRTPDGP